MAYQHLGYYSDLVKAAQRSNTLDKVAKPGKATQRKLLDALSWKPGPIKPAAVRKLKTWTRDGVAGELISWSVGYGPRTEAYVLKPVGAKGKLPGVVALHDHSGVKYFGKEKIADDNTKVKREAQKVRDGIYEGVAYANELAKRGYVVLVPDVFLWGSRRIEESVMRAADMYRHRPRHPRPTPIEDYDLMSIPHEHLVERYCAVLGTTLAGVVSFEDRIAAEYLRKRKDVKPGGVGCVGLSGGGMRSALLNATCDHIRAAVVVGAMTDYPGMYDRNVASHTWMFFPRNWPERGDWADMAACRAPTPLMVLSDTNDELFSLKGMKAGHKRIRTHYKSVGASQMYEDKFYPGHHKFDLTMQADVFDFFDRHLRG